MNEYWRVGAKLDGVADKAVVDQLDKLAAGIRNRALGAALNKCLTPVERTAEKLVRVRSGLTRKAISKKVKKYSSGTVVGMVGIDANLIGQYNGKKVWPNKFFHILEGGQSSHYQPKRRVTHPGAKGKAILLPALMAHKGELLQNFADKVQDEINKIVSKG